VAGRIKTTEKSNDLSGNGTRDLPTYIIRMGPDKFLAFPIWIFAAQPKEFFLDGLKKLEQQSHKCVELRGDFFPMGLKPLWALAPFAVP
jgi:hypothetical protein